LSDNVLLLSVEHIESDDCTNSTKWLRIFFNWSLTLTKLHTVNDPDYKWHFVFNLYYMFKLCLKTFSYWICVSPMYQEAI
jgi:hypothetical protein